MGAGEHGEVGGPREAADPRLLRYQVMGPLGGGGQGRTYRGIARDTGREVAIKVVSLKKLRDWKAFELFEREVAVLRTLAHPGVVRFVDSYASETTGDYFLVMELVEGQSLGARLRAEGPLPRALLADVFRQALEVLAYLHGRVPPVVHRDLKPDNFILRPDGRLVLVDFGGVYRPRAESEGGGSTMIGTLGYMAPEQLHGETTPASDLYALGATLCALCAGRPADALPRDGLRIDLRAIPDSLPHREIVARLLEPDPTLRFRSVQEVQSALRTKGVGPVGTSNDADPGFPIASLVPRSLEVGLAELGKLPRPASLLLWALATMGAGAMVVLEAVVVPVVAFILTRLQKSVPRSVEASPNEADVRSVFVQARGVLEAVARATSPGREPPGAETSPGPTAQPPGADPKA